MARSLWLSLALLGSVSAASIAVFGGDAKPPAEPPKPPTTPEPAFENPAFDAKIGETLFYSVRDLEGKRPMRYFEERVLALTKDKILIETVETDATDTKFYSVEKSTRLEAAHREADRATSTRSGFRRRRRPRSSISASRPRRRSARCIAILDEPADFTLLEGPRRVRQIWYSHDIPASGRAKMFPALRDGERMVISWDRMLPADECAKRAARYPDQPDEGHKLPEAPADPAMGEPGMDDPGMGEPAMDGEVPPKDPAGMDGEPTKPEPAMGA